MIGIFNNKATKEDLKASNGEYILDSICFNFKVTEELNGEYGADAGFYIVDDFPKAAYDLIKEDSLIKVNEEYGIEYLRIAQVSKNADEINIYARHITISEILTLFCEDVRPTGLNGVGALNWIFDNAKGDNWLEVMSDIDSNNTAYYQNKNVYEALYTADNSFLNRWGGESYRRGFRLEINNRVGANRGFSIRTGKNLINLEEDTNISSLTTRIYPKGFDGISIPEKYIDSPLVNNYGKVYSKEVKFDKVKVKGESDEEGFDTLAEAQEELRRLTLEMYSKQKVDVIGVTYNVDFVELSKTEEGKDFSGIEKTYLGDDVTVIDENMNIDIVVRVTKRVYDVLREVRTSTELSNKDTKAKPPSIKDIFDKIASLPDEDSILAQAKKDATDLINAGLKDSYVIVRKNEILIMDTPDPNTAKKIWRWNNGGLGYSSTGYYGTFGTAITNDGKIVADFIATGILNANLIKTGLLQSLNGVTTINMETGKFTNVVDGYGIEIERGGMVLTVENEVVGGLMSARFASDKSINGINLANTLDGDYLSLGFTEADDFQGSVSFTSMLRIAKIAHQLLGNFKGIQLLENTRMQSSKTLYFESQSDNPHEMFNSSTSHMCVFGDNGVILGYKNGDERVTVFQVTENQSEYGTQAYINKQLSMTGKKIISVDDIYRYADNTRYLHEGWVGSVEKTVKRISNLNVLYDSGWYGFATGANGSPVPYWGVMLHLKLTEDDFMQLVIGTNNKLYTRCWVNNAWSSWAEK